MILEFPLLDACDPRSCIAGKINFCERVISNIYRKHLKSHNITNSQFTMLMVVTKVDKIRQKDLASFMCLEKSTVTRNLKRLLEGDLVVKSDKKELSTTQRGKQKLEEMIPSWELAMKETEELLKKEGQRSIDTLFQQLKNK